MPALFSLLSNSGSIVVVIKSAYSLLFNPKDLPLNDVVFVGSLQALGMKLLRTVDKPEYKVNCLFF